MKNRIIIIISVIGILGGIASAILSSFATPPLPPAFPPAESPYSSAIYAEGIVESAQTSGENINIYPEVEGTVKEILVSEGQQVKAGQPLLRLDDSIQRATAEQLGSQAEAATALFEELKAEPRKETLDVNVAQVVSAQATLKTAQDTSAENASVLRDGSAICQQRCVGRSNQCRRGCESESRSCRKDSTS